MSHTQEKKAVSLKSMLEDSRTAIAALIPKHMDAEQVVRTAWLACYKEPKLRTADPVTVVQGVMQAASLGLIIGRNAHLVPFFNKDKGQFDAVFVPDYRGLVDLARRGGGVIDVEARVVYKGETFEVHYGDTPTIKHTPRFDVPRRWEDIVAFYAVATLAAGVKKFDVMTFAEVDAIRERVARGKTPWTGSDGDKTEMGKKTIVKRLAKLLPQSPELASALEYDTRAEVGAIGAVLPLDDEAALAAAITARSEERMELLKAEVGAGAEKKSGRKKLGAGSPPPAEAPADERRTEVVEVVEEPPAAPAAPTTEPEPWPDWPKEA